MSRPFSTVDPKYDMNTFWGRTRYFAESINPMLLLENERTLQKHQLLLDQWKGGKAPQATDKELWRARCAVEQCIHPTTGAVIFPAFRMCMFLPMNYFIVPFMMMPSTVMSVQRTLAIQWFNQSFNSAVNYANRSSESQPASEVGKAYVATVVVACGGCLGATALLKRVPTTSVKGMVIRGTVPFFAVGAAAVVNLGLMRKNEWMSQGKGITVKDEDGIVRGSSTAAGRDSLAKCSATRILWNVPSMVLPTLMMVPLMRVSPFCKRYSVATEALLQMLGLTVGVPPALAAFNLIQSVPATSLEPRFHGLKRQNGAPVVNYTYYKGL